MALTSYHTRAHFRKKRRGAKYRSRRGSTQITQRRGNGRFNNPGLGKMLRLRTPANSDVLSLND